jgi:hypothetical protein
LPFKLPRRVRYYVSSLIAQTALNIVGADVAWLLGTATPIHPLFVRVPIVLYTDDPKVVLPKRELSRIPKLSLVNEWRLLKNRKIHRIVVPTEMMRRKIYCAWFGGR